ncbi:MAG TPA: glycosyltransferase [Ramlibacter sp.]|nr:glycosyltransferase [Ramlibacter sp.]
MKVLHVIPSVSAVHGGPSRAIGLIERALTARGVRVETATTDDDGPRRRLDRPLRVAVPENGVQRWFFMRQLHFYKVSLDFARWIRQRVRDYDLVHVHGLFSFTSVLAAWTARSARVPYVIRPLGTLNHYGIAQRRPELKQLSLRFIERGLLRDASAVHFTSIEEAEQAGDLGIALRSVIIPLGVEACPGPLAAEAAGTQRLLFLSRLDPKKNVEGLLRAFSLCKAQLPGLVLHIAGAGEHVYVASLHALAKQLGVSQDVVWMGHVEGDEKARALAEAQAFVLPSLSENFGIAAAEALMAGLPCILARGVPLAPSMQEAGAGLCVEPDAESIADGIRQLMSDPQGRQRMRAAAAALARQKYSVHAMGDRLAGLYTDILART